MHDPAKVLRWLVVAQLGLGCVGLPSLLGGDDEIPASLGIAWFDVARPRVETMAWWALPVIATACWLAGTIGILRRWRPARALYAISVVMSVLSGFGMRFWVVTDWEGVVGHVGTLVEGATLALLYLTTAHRPFVRAGD